MGFNSAFKELRTEPERDAVLGALNFREFHGIGSNK
jgi:hypothetical protein